MLRFKGLSRLPHRDPVYKAALISNLRFGPMGKRKSGLVSPVTKFSR